MDQNVTGRSENRKNKVHNNEGKVLTLWAVEDASLGTGLDGLVQASVEGSIGSSTKVMVGLDVLLDGLTAIENEKSQLTAQAKCARRAEIATTTRQRKKTNLLPLRSLSCRLKTSC